MTPVPARLTAPSASRLPARRPLALLGLVVMLSAVACDRGTQSGGPPTGTVRDSADQVMYGVRSALTNAGLRRGELTAQTAYALDASTRFELRDAQAQLLSTTGRPLALITARVGTFWLNRSLLEMRGAVTIISDTTGRRIDGASVRYDAVANRIASDSPFVATSRGRRLAGVGFTADPGLFTVRCAKSCSGSLGQ